MNSLILIHLSIITTIFYTSAQFTTDNCKSNEKCTPLNKCPEILALAKSSDTQNVRKYLNSICGLKPIAMVCCPVRADLVTSDILPGDVLPQDCGLPSTQFRIINGTATAIGSFPWVVALGYSILGVRNRIDFLCGGAIISSRYVVTAAHCVDPNQLSTRRLSVIHVGDWDLSTPEDCQSRKSGSICYPPHVVAKPERIIMHPDYNRRATDSDDIAIIRLDQTINFSSLETAPITPICLPTPSTRPRAPETSAIAAGWGFTENNTSSDILLRVLLPVADEQKCINFFGSQFIKEDQLCYGGKDQKDTCSGDSGGPLMLPSRTGPPFTLIGLVSYGAFPCAKENTPAVYTSVASYVSWIKGNLVP